MTVLAALAVPAGLISLWLCCCNLRPAGLLEHMKDWHVGYGSYVPFYEGKAGGSQRVLISKALKRLVCT